mmetsp:Transcript_9559/g.26793  ORF Transcript_9559/g.26793 Transcript_9559/m.26793 type:complete len:240 (-) Transcript_9559:3515-4234(-)
MSQQDQTVVVGPMAHTKMLLHACQNPYTQVHGVLLGSFGTRQSSGGVGPELTLTDAIPVFHSSPTKPLLDMALQLIEAHTANSSRGGGGIVGWYSANERLGDDDRPGQAALRIVGGIAAGLDGMGKAPPTHAEPVAVLVSNRGAVDVLGGDDNVVADLKVFGRDRVHRQQWIKMYAPDHVKCSSTGQKVVREVCSVDAEVSAAPAIYDFEDHLDGGAENLATRDWLTNTIVTNLVRKSA